MPPRTWVKVGGLMNAVNPLNDAALNPLGAGVVGTWQSIPDTGNVYGGGVGAHRGTEGFTAVVNDWCGAVYDSNRLWVHGGGHNGYAGNEVISIDLSSASPIWRIERPPSGWNTSDDEGLIDWMDHREDLKIYTNGDPRSSHTYDNMAWGNGVLYVLPSACFAEPSGTETDAAYEIFQFTPGANPTVGVNASYGTWSNLTTMPDVGQAHYSGSLVYDSLRNRLYVSAGSLDVMERFDIASNTWLSATPAMNADSDRRCVYVSSLDLVICLNWYPSGKFTLYKPSTNTMHSPGATGTAPSPVRSGSGSSTLEYWTAANWVPELGAVVSWAEGGTGFHTLTPPVGDPTTNAWVWGRLEASAGNTITPDPRNGNGDYGRFFYSPEMRCLGVVTATNSGAQAGGLTSSGQLNIFALP
jgi:hypothetical protein